MLRRVFGPALLAALVISLPAFTADDPKKKNDASQTPIDSDKLPPGDYTGKLLTTPGSDGSFTLQIDRTYTTPTAAYTARLAGLQAQIQAEQVTIAQLQAQAAVPRKGQNVQNRLTQALAKLQQLQAQAQPRPNEINTNTDTKVYDMMLMDNADIRYLNLPQVFDDMGKVKTYTAEEKKELKGKKTNLPGYEGKLDDLKVGQTVKVTLTRVLKKPDAKKDDAKKDDAKKDDAKTDTKSDDAKKDTTTPKKDDTTDNTPPDKKIQAKMILILQEPPDTSSNDTPKKKKKKNNNN